MFNSYNSELKVVRFKFTTEIMSIVCTQLLEWYLTVKQIVAQKECLEFTLEFSLILSGSRITFGHNRNIKFFLSNLYLFLE